MSKTKSCAKPSTKSKGIALEPGVVTDDGEQMPAGMYATCTEYPEEGFIGPLGVESEADSFDARYGYFDARYGYDRQYLGLKVDVVPWMRGYVTLPE